MEDCRRGDEVNRFVGGARESRVEVELPDAPAGTQQRTEGAAQAGPRAVVRGRVTGGAEGRRQMACAEDVVEQELPKGGKQRVVAVFGGAQLGQAHHRGDAAERVGGEAVTADVGECGLQQAGDGLEHGQEGAQAVLHVEKGDFELR
ncbi:catalase/peroxidase HPI [Babesia caballi]|uniref:Catalase/peroxidase HPI n=1 Tax=Babesia caballi TaxID=5871 RepID=A0AAV4LW63_BABCB|nr:catalase/peroxidase HPI [Babesia caballi]